MPSAATWWKVIVPVATIIVLLSLSFHPQNLHAGGGLRTVSFMFGLLLVLFVIYVAYFYLGSPKRETFGWRHILWLAPYFGGLWLLDLIGPTAVKGYGLISFGVDMGLAALFSLAILWLALKTALPEDEVETVSRQISETQNFGEKQAL